MENNEKTNETDEKRKLYEISKRVEKVEKLVKEYETVISQGNYEKLTPYTKIITLYKEIINELLEMKNQEGATLDDTIINKYKARMEKISKRIENLRFEEEIGSMVNKANKLARSYEITLKKGGFEQECPYFEIIEIYKDIINKLLDKGWISQLENYSREIEIYKKKLEKDKNLREIENQKISKQKAFERARKINEVDSVEAVLQSLDNEMRVLTFEEKKQEKDKEFNKILNLIDNAEKIVKEYKKNIKKSNVLEIDSPYEEVLNIYEKAKERFKDLGWKDASNKLLDSIDFYKQELEKDQNLREYEAKKSS
ncbi:MAG: hypothetical protein KGD57_08660 [Candidatus Lokiarchaeota archaeon]|nr:hypothetical protein [Candidatus Lokiarchaeota archaeon]